MQRERDLLGFRVGTQKKGTYVSSKSRLFLEQVMVGWTLKEEEEIARC